MTTRYVHKKKGKASGSFDTPVAPARNIGDALKVAKAGDTIQIQDSATYKEEELVIDKSLTIVSKYLLANPDSDPTIPSFKLKKFPEITIKSGARHRVMRIVGTPETRTKAGPVLVKGVRITGGVAVHTAREPALGAGGGIAVIDIDNVTIERCVITGNRTQVAPVTRWPESDRLALRTALLDIVGEIVTPGFEVFINGPTTAANLVLSRLGYPPLPQLLDREGILANLGKKFDEHLKPGRKNSWLAGQAFGGGLALVWASPKLSRCLIRENTAEGRGAGLAVVGYGWPTIDACWIDENSSGATGRRDGGGVSCEIALPGKMTRNLQEIHIAKFLLGKLSEVKKAIQSPLDISSTDIIEYVKRLANQSQPSPQINGMKAIVLDLINGKWTSLFYHTVYFYAISALSRNPWDAWNKDEVELAQKMAVTFNECRLSRNSCYDDGGGLYASVLSRVRLSKTKITHNHAGDSGGGVRLSMGSAGELTDCELIGNTAIVIEREKMEEEKKRIAGGGGLSARNVDLILTNTRIGSETTGISTDSNICSDHAGGGIAFQADTEGDLAGIPDLWTAIMVGVFGVREVSVLIKENCSITNNGAGFDERRTGLSKTSKAKGGGIWLLQGEFPDAPKVNLSIEAVTTTIHKNSARTKGYISKVQPDTAIATANEVCIQDMVGHKEWTESNYRPLLSSGVLRFTP